MSHKARKPLRVYRDMGGSMELQGEWMGTDRSAFRRKRKGPTKGLPAAPSSAASSSGSSFLPELVDAVGDVGPRPFREDASTSSSSSSSSSSPPLLSHRCNAATSGSNVFSKPEGDVWSAYAELQSAYSALQASELSASTHLQQSSGLLEKEKKRVSSLKDKLARSVKERDAAKAQLAAVLFESKEMSNALGNQTKKLEAAKERLQEAEATRASETQVRQEAERGLADLRVRLETHTIHMAEADDAVKMLTVKIEALTTRLNTAEQDVITANACLAASKEEYVKLQAQWASRKKTVDGLSEKCSALEKEVARLSALEDSHAETSKELETLKQTQNREAKELRVLKKSHAALLEKEESTILELESVRASLEQEQKKSCSAAEARDKALQTSRSQSLLHKDALEAAKRDAKSRSAEAIALLRDELTPLQEELKRLSPLESELSDARRIGELLQSQIGQSHEREDQLRSELLTAKEELESMRKQLAEAQGLRAKEAQSKSDSRSAAQKQKDMELAAFKKELADVRAKQLFAVNEVKVLMAKLAAKGGNGKSHGGSSNSINNSAECGEAQQIDFIDENLKRLKQRKGRKGASGSGFVTSGNYTKKQGGAQRMHRKR